VLANPEGRQGDIVPPDHVPAPAIVEEKQHMGEQSAFGISTPAYLLQQGTALLVDCLTSGARPPNAYPPRNRDGGIVMFSGRPEG
jgi:hypothetical protein